MTDTTYRVVVTREGTDWLAEVPGLPGGHTYANSMQGLHDAVREVIALVEDLPQGAETELALQYEVHTGNADVGRPREGRE